MPTKAASKLAFKRSGQEAKKISSAFTSKSSKFARKEEERHVSQQEAQKNFNERAVVAKPEEPSPFELAQQSRQKRGRDFGGFDDSDPKHGDHLLPGMGRRGEDHKDAKKERFEQVIATSRQEKAESQKKREVLGKATDNIDQEFNQISHLLKQRTRKDIDKWEFEHPTNQETAAWWIEQKAKRESRAFTLSSSNSGSLKVTDTREGLDDADMALLEKIRSQDPSKKAEKAIEKAALEAGVSKKQQKQAAMFGGDADLMPPQSAADDEFDKMLSSLRFNTSKTAKAAAPAPTEEDEAAGKQLQEAMKLAQSAAPAVVTGDAPLTKKDWIASGGDSAFDMNDNEEEGDGEDREDYDYDQGQGGGAGDPFTEFDEDDGEGEEGDDQPKSGPDAQIYNELEAIEKLIAKAASQQREENKDSSRSSSNGAIMKHASVLYSISKKSPTAAVTTFRNFLMECEKTRDTTPLALIIFYLITVIFPTTDFHHPVMTPLRIMLCHRLAKIELISIKDVRLGLYYAAILQSTLLPQEKFAAEVLTLLYNVFSLAIPMREVKADHGVPLLNRKDFPNCADVAAPELVPFSLLTDLALNDDEEGDSPEDFLRTLGNSYQFAVSVFTAMKPSPSFESMAAPFVKLGQRLDTRKQRFSSTAHAGDIQKAFYELVSTGIEEAPGTRMPLAMRTFRPKPIKLFDPLMVESEADQTKKELKRELREDRKRVVRHLQAEATVHRKDMERTNAADDRRREGKLKELMSELQAQQHIMKTVDVHRTKSREKKRGKVSGDYNDGGSSKGAGKKTS